MLNDAEEADETAEGGDAEVSPRLSGGLNPMGS
jgi:hypothetical protein